MEKYYQAIILWYCVINILLFAAMGIDKHKAVKHKWRIPERNLLLAAFLGGFAGGYAGMYIFHHKSRKIYFHVIFILSAVLHIFLLFKIL